MRMIFLCTKAHYAIVSYTVLRGDMTNRNRPPRQVLGQTIAADLEAEIMLGQLDAGSRLDEVALAKRFGVSRTPVREALQIVVSRALAVRVPYKGVIVSDISPERIDQATAGLVCGDRHH